VFRMRTRKLRRTEEDDSPIDHWSRLSDEMVLFILRFLPLKDLVKVSLINKRMRKLSRDDSLWTELTLDYEDIKLSADSCRRLVERCKKLARLKITNKNDHQNPLNIMSVVIRAKDRLKVLEIDRSIHKWTDVALSKLGQMKELRRIALKFDFVDDENAKHGMQQLNKLHQLEVLCVRTRLWKAMMMMMSNELQFQHFKKLKEVDILFASANFVAVLRSNNPDLKVLRLLFWRKSNADGTLTNRYISNDAQLDVIRSECPGIDIKRSYYSVLRRRC